MRVDALTELAAASAEVDLLLALARPVTSRTALDDTLATAAGLVVDGLDWDAWLDLVGRHRVVELIHDRLERLDRPRRGLPASVRERLSTSVARTRVRNAALLRAAGELTESAASRRVPLLVRKGLPLAQRVYGDPAGRSMSDIDVLAPRSSLPALRALLEDLGYEYGLPSDTGIVRWTRAAEIALGFGGVNVPGFARPDPVAGFVEVGIAVALFARASGIDFPLDAIFERAAPTVVDGVSLPALGLVDSLVDVCSHFTKDAKSIAAVQAGADLALYKFCDVGGLFGRVEAAGAVDEFVRVVHEGKLGEPVYFALRYVDDLFPGVVPGEVLAGMAPDDHSYLDWYGESEKTPRERHEPTVRARLFRPAAAAAPEDSRLVSALAIDVSRSRTVATPEDAGG